MNLRQYQCAPSQTKWGRRGEHSQKEKQGEHEQMNVKYSIVLRQLEIHQHGGRERDKPGFPSASGRRLSLHSPVLSWLRCKNRNFILCSKEPVQGLKSQMTFSHLNVVKKKMALAAGWR